MKKNVYTYRADGGHCDYCYTHVSSTPLAG